MTQYSDRKDSASVASPVPPRLYRRHFTAQECVLLQSHADTGGSSEVNLVRVLLSRLASAGQRGRRMPLKDQISLLAAVAGSTAIIAALFRLQARYDAGEDPLLKLFADMDPEDL